VSIKDIVKGSLAAFRRSSSLKRRFSALKRDDEAVVLFTSGTESMPKGVPLTHENILSNIEASIKTVELFRSDRLLAFLPPFHSFGFTITGFLPLLCALRVVYFPNPTDSKRLAKAIQKWHVNVLCTAPTFLKNILLSANKTQLQQVRMVISGAEKAADELKALFHKICPKALFVEGYGITECSPVLSANVSGDPKKGVGAALEGTKFKIVDPENFEQPKKQGEVGLILASGPSVFSGYLNKVKQDPFVTLDDVTWYQTGDLGSLDEEGNLRLMGRLKRFVKVGGEMISLAALEEALSRHSGDQVSSIVMAEDDPVGRPRLVLFTTEDYSAESANQLLRKSGFSNLAKIERVVHLDALPQTATGKVSFRELTKRLQEGKSV
jgi:long-chain-fatty-acid--[acyl-carrier-protein] ligase